MKRKVLFLCTGNSCRSQIAEAVVNARLGTQWEAFSAGTRPAGYVHPLALRALAEIGIVHAGCSKHADELRAVPFDLVVTVCDSAAEDCPVWLGQGRRVHLGFPDPAAAVGSAEEVMAVFRAVRDEIAAKVPALLQPLDPVSALTPGAGGLPRLVLSAPDGARAEITLHGAHITSWVPAGGQERLFLSRTSAFSPDTAIRGGVPVIFPQFAGLGPLPKHGFARALPWAFAGAAATTDGATATFHLRDSEASRRIWAHAFLAGLTVSIGGDRLAVTLAVTNTGAEALTFTAALHTYLAVADIAAMAVTGLAGVRYRDSAAGGVEGIDAGPQVRFAGEVDRIYFDAPSELRVIEPARTTVVRSAGFPDAVVWNPGAAKGAALADLEPDGCRRFVCVEAAAIGAPVHLAPGERWLGTQTLTDGQVLRRGVAADEPAAGILPRYEGVLSSSTGSLKMPPEESRTIGSAGLHSAGTCSGTSPVVGLPALLASRPGSAAINLAYGANAGM